MNEEPNCNLDELLDWLCWMWAKDGERFYPPRETAWKCVEACMDAFEERTNTDEMLALEVAKAYEWEKGQHGRAYTDTVDKFYHLKCRGFDPVMRAEREVKRSRDEGENLSELDWTWWKESGRSDMEGA